MECKAADCIMNMKIKNSNLHLINKWNIAYVVFLCLISVVLFWKCKYGYTFLDEGFYPTIAYRFIQGDRILFDEWNNTQLSNFLLIPLMKGFLKINGDFTGIYLFIRYAYTVLKIVISISIYRTLKAYSKLGAMISSICFLVFAGYGMMCLSYNSMASGGIAICLLLLINSMDKAGIKQTMYCLFSGVALSAAVLANPYCALLYVAYFIACMVCSICNKKKDNKNTEIYCIRNLWWMTVGIAVMVVIFAGYVLSHTSLEQILQTMPHILNGDPAHPAKNLYYMTAGYLARILVGNNRNFVLLGIYLLQGIAVLGYLVCKNRKNYVAAFVGTEAILNIVLFGVYWITENYINNMIFIPNIIALELVIAFYDNPKIKRLFVCFWIPGFLYTYTEYLSSNTGFAGISSASCVAAIGSIVIIGFVIEQNIGKVNNILLYVFLALTFIGLLVMRITYTFWDADLKMLTTEITEGPCKGLITTEETARRYDVTYKDTEWIRNLDADTKVLYIADKSLWLAGEQRCASYLPLCYSISNTDLIYEYYDEHPEKQADVVYIDISYGIEFAEVMAENMNMTIMEKECGWALENTDADD